MEKTLLKMLVLIISSMAVITVIIMVSTNAIIQHEKTNIINTRTVRTAILANSAEDQIDNFMEILVATSKLPQVMNTQYADQITKTLKGIPENVDLNKRQVARDILSASDDFATIRFFMPNGDMYMQEPYSAQQNLKQLNFAFRDYFQGAVNTKQPYISEVFKAQSTNQNTACITVPIYVNNSLIGIWSGLLNVEELRKNLLDVPLEKNVSAKFFDHKGAIIYDTDQQKGQSTNYSGYKNLVDLAESGKQGNDLVNINGVKMLVAYHGFVAGNHNWAILLVQPYDDAFVVIEETKTLSYALLIFVLIGAMVTSLVAYQMIRTKFSLIWKLEKMNQRLTESKNEFINLYDKNPDLLCTVNTEGMLVDCNKTYATILGYPKKELIGKSVFNHTADVSAEKARDSFSSFIINGQIRDNEIWIKKRDGSIFPSLISANGRFDKDGKLQDGIVTIKDATELYNTKKRLIEKERQVTIEEEKVKNSKLIAIGATASRLAHDLRNPLSVIKNTIEIVKSKYSSNSLDSISFNNYCVRIDNAISRLTHQVDGVLDFVRISPLLISEVSLLPFLKNICEKIPHSSEIEFELPKNYCYLNCDERKLEVVLTNLLLNAVEAIGHQMGKITIGFAKTNEIITIQISDTGQGIPENIRDKIFEPLFTTKQKGTGLGLASCKNIIEQHGGKIWVESEVGKGTSIYFTLPTIMSKTRLC